MAIKGQAPTAEPRHLKAEVIDKQHSLLKEAQSENPWMLS